MTNEIRMPKVGDKVRLVICTLKFAYLNGIIGEITAADGHYVTATFPIGNGSRKVQTWSSSLEFVD